MCNSISEPEENCNWSCDGAAFNINEYNILHFTPTFVAINQMNEGQQGDVEVHLGVERRGARLAAGRGQARVQLPGGARHPGQQELLRLLSIQI